MGPVDQRSVRIPVEHTMLEGDLFVPPKPRGIVVFAHGSGSSRHSRRNHQVANALVDEGFATLLFDLLTEREGMIDAQTAELRFDIGLLAARTIAVVDWVRAQPALRGLRIGLFGASTGAAAALVAAASRPEAIGAVVSRGGRPDLAGVALGHVRAPTLLVVGSEDRLVVRLNQAARSALRCESEIRLVAGATHLFEEPGALEEVARIASTWFLGHLARDHAFESVRP